jgi:hypothetical protein
MNYGNIADIARYCRALGENLKEGAQKPPKNGKSRPATGQLFPQGE